MSENELVPETTMDYEEVFRRGGRNHEDEDFALFKCPSCGHVYLLEYEVDTVYLDGYDLSRRVHVFAESFDCVQCGLTVPKGEPWIGPRASPKFGVTWAQLAASEWAWVVKR